ncbi:probable 28S ribosomal protein S16, mitochondrial [Dendronephthya gigantea]|uniref:probable 28S ribosomal protein S16, mitochondrial n=1 Tax=Dendronephthya gigantea TaxID=151771 RepID=UPI0010697341|nr:probable 28S ribosomal protein S16, mitochondrial [Dendronephthya gigantea]
MARVRKPSVVLRLALYGCPNRPFFHIVAGKRRAARNRYIYEQLGVYDPMPNEHNEKIVSLNIDRIKYWLAHGAEPKKPVSVLLGLAGILPVHPYSIEVARRNRENPKTGGNEDSIPEDEEESD